MAGLLIKIGVAYTAVDRAMADAGLAEDLEVSLLQPIAAPHWCRRLGRLTKKRSDP